MTIDMGLIVVGAALLIIGMAARVIERLCLSPVLVSFLMGVVLGPEVLGILDPRGAGFSEGQLGEVAEVALVLALVGIGLQMRPQELRDNARRVVRLLTVGMVGMWLLTGLGAVLLLGLPAWSGLLLGAVLTPTDPVVASSLVGGRMAEANLPEWLRDTLQLESGANDGLAFPFVRISVLALTMPAAQAISEGAVGILRELGIDIIVGLLLGLALGKLTRFEVEHRETGGSYLLIVGAALAFTALGSLRALGGSGILGAFVAAVAFSAMLGERLRQEVDHVQEGLVTIALVPVFVLFGAMLPVDGWLELGPPGVVFALWVLLVRRPPIVPVALAATRTDGRSVLWLAWFGPLGVAAIGYASEVATLPLEGADRLFAAATLAVSASILAHGITATPATRTYAGRPPLWTLRHPFHPEAERER